MTKSAIKCLSLWQPWAWLVASGLKDIENRTWRTSFRGELLIHASSHRPTKRELASFREFCKERFTDGSDLSERAIADGTQFGGFIGVAQMIACFNDEELTKNDSPWSRSGWAIPGQWHWLLTCGRRVPFVEASGQRGLFDPHVTPAGGIILRGAIEGIMDGYEE